MPESKHALLLRMMGFKPCDAPLVAIVTSSSEETQTLLEKGPDVRAVIMRELAGRLLYGEIPGIEGTFVRDELGQEWFCGRAVDLSFSADFVSSKTLVEKDLRSKMN